MFNPLEIVLTAAQMRFYAVLVELYVKNGRVTFRDLTAALGFTSNNAVNSMIRPLVRKGFVQKHGSLAGGIVPLYRLEFFRESVPCESNAK